MPITIVRTAWTDDDGSGGTGTVLNNNAKTSLYEQIDEALSYLSTSTGGLATTSTGSTGQVLHGPSTSPRFSTIVEAVLSLSDVTTFNLTTGRHGFAPKAGGTLLKGLTDTGGFVMPRAVGGMVVLATSTSPTIDASLGSRFRLSLSGSAAQFQPPSNPSTGQRLIIEVNASSGALTVTLSTAANGFNFGSDISAASLTAVSSGKTDYIGTVFNHATSYWDVVAYAKGY